MIRVGCWSTWRVAVADGATTISDVAVLADQAALFGSVASDSTCWRLLDQLDTAQLGAFTDRYGVWEGRRPAVLLLAPPLIVSGDGRSNQVIGRQMPWHVMWHELTSNGVARPQP